MEINIRELRLRDRKAIHNLFYETWYKDDWQYTNPDLAHAYVDWDVNYCLNDSTFGRVADLDGKVVGLILGRVGVQQKEMRKFQVHNPESLITFLKASDSERKEIVQDIEEDQKLSKELIGGHRYGGEVVALLVDEAYKRQGIGSLLFDSLFQHFSNFHLVDFYLLTDSNCDFKFYEYKKMNRRASKKQSDGSIAYLYDYEF